MTPRGRPDHDPDLRRAFALSADEQRQLLASLVTPAQTADPSGQNASSTFEPVPVRLRRTALALSCIPTQFPADVTLVADSPHLKIIVDHDVFQHRAAPRTLQGMADVEAAVAAYGAPRGVVTMRYPSPASWTFDTLRDVVNRAIRYIPDAQPRQAFEIVVCKMFRQDIWRFMVRPHGNSEYFAEVRVAASATDVLRRYCAAFGKNRYAPAALETFDRVIRQHRTAEHTPAPKDIPARQARGGINLRNRGTFAHPEDTPDVDDMLDALSRSDLQTGFGRHNFRSARDIAADAECEIYNAWVKLQAIQKNLLPPGRLTPEEFVSRFWTEE